MMMMTTLMIISVAKKRELQKKQQQQQPNEEDDEEDDANNDKAFFLKTVGSNEKNNKNNKPVYQSKDFYSPEWWKTWDLVLLIGMGTGFCMLMVVSGIVYKELYTEMNKYYVFWLGQIAKLSFMSFVAYLGGLLVIHYQIKVNYTRKIQHFCAYLVPLLLDKIETLPPTEGANIVREWWGYWFVLLSFAIFVYPLRTRVRILDIMFASLDRPEDRPNTLKWITSQIVVGYTILTLFKVFFHYSGRTEAANLIFIPVIITGIGDGLAEPVGIRFGKHKYWTKGLCLDKKYTRSLEGSACVLVTGWIACAAFYRQFAGWLHFTIAFFIVPLAMTLAEAFSPHTWDTPFLLTTGCGLLWLISFLPAN